MDLTRQQCEMFKKNPKINPLTGRTIEIGKSTHQELMQACERFEMKTGKNSPGSYVPSIGPMIHWNQGDADENMSEFVEYIDEKTQQYAATTKSLSKMEIEEMYDILEIAKKQYDHDKDYVKYVNDVKKQVDGVVKKSQLFDDVPKNEIYEDMRIKSNRVYNRAQVLDIFNSYSTIKKILSTVVNKQDIKYDILPGEIKIQKSHKKYLDRLIELKIFTKDDIYKKVFKNEKWLEEIEDLWGEYTVLYKKVKGKSPGK